MTWHKPPTPTFRYRDYDGDELNITADITDGIRVVTIRIISRGVISAVQLPIPDHTSDVPNLIAGICAAAGMSNPFNANPH